MRALLGVPICVSEFISAAIQNQSGHYAHLSSYESIKSLRVRSTLLWNSHNVGVLCGANVWESQ